MKRFYRLHGPDLPLEGIYHYDCGAFDLPFDNQKHPSPEEDSIILEYFTLKGFYPNRYFYGFSSLDQLWAWFYYEDFITYCLKKGICLSVYEVPEEIYCAGNSQMIVDSNWFEYNCHKPIKTYLAAEFPRSDT